MKKLYFSIIIFVFCTCCETTQKEISSEKYTVELENLYQTNFQKGFTEPSLKPLELYQKVEDYFVFSGLLNGKDKSDYKLLYSEYVWQDTIPDLSCLYKIVPDVQLLYFPKNIEANISNYRAVVEKFSPNTNSSIFQAQKALESLTDGIHFNYKNTKLLLDYIESIKEEDFSENIIYRAPLIAVAHASFVDRATKEN